MAIVLTEELALEMAQTGVLYGHARSKTHPRMKPYIGGQRNEMELLAPQATVDSMNRAETFLKKEIGEGKMGIFVGTLPSAQEAIKQWARELKMPYVVTRWLGGTITNFSVIHARLMYYEGLKSKKEKGEFVRYTKKEQLKFNEEIQKLSKLFDGLSLLGRVPSFVFVADIETHMTAVREAQRLSIPIVAIMDSDDDPKGIDYPIFANDHAKASVDWVIEKLKQDITLPVQAM